MSRNTVRRRLILRRLLARPGGPRPRSDFTPTRIVVFDIERPLSSIDAGPSPSGEPYGVAEILVRLHARPVGVLTVDLATGPVPARRLQELIDQQWGDVIRRHLAFHDGWQGADHGSDGRPDPWQTCALAQPASPPSVSVVVPTCRRPGDLVRCVDSILATGYPRLEVIVVDNGPQEPGTATLVAERYSGDDRIRYAREWTPGASRARNLGVRAARGEIVAFADDDVVVDRYWLSALSQALVGNPDVDCVTGLVIPAALDTPVHLWFEQFGGFNRGYEQRVFDLAEQRGDTLLYPYTAGALGGLGNCAFRRSALRQPDAFDVTLGPGTPAFGAEDQDAFVALLRTGGRLLYEPAALVRHRHRDDYADLRWQIFTYGAGQTAAFVHWALHDRAVATELARRIPAVLAGVLRPRRQEASAGPMPETCRRELRWLEWMGYLYGPVAYGRALHARRRIGAPAAPAPHPSPRPVERLR